MLKVNKEELLNSRLNDGTTTTNEFDDEDTTYCLKCSFIKAAEADHDFEDRGWQSSIENAYWSLIGYASIDEDDFERTIRYKNKAWCKKYPELAEVLDIYERKLIEGDREGLLERFVAELETKKLVEFV